ncbi:MAG: restriction endonuclease subunit S [Gammaproteobacteria bacterium]|nr:restriction endonuclease subunit S [Gammaproteobacteria bacterium]
MRITVANYCDLLEEDSYRIDSEFWDERLIQSEVQVRTDFCIRDLVSPQKEVDKLTVADSPINYLEISDVDLDSTMYQLNLIQPESVPSRATYLLRKDDVAVSMVRPSRNAVSFIQSDEIVASSGFTILRPTRVSAEYLWAFCKTEFFRRYLTRRQRNSMYPAVRKEDILNAPIYMADSEIEHQIASKIEESTKRLKLHYQEYENIQFDFLKFIEFRLIQSSDRRAFIRFFSDVIAAKRLDAKFFDLSFSAVDRSFRRCSRTLKLGDIASLQKGVEVGKEQYMDEGIPFVRVSDISRHSLRFNKMIDKEVFEQYSFSRIQQDDILFTKDGTVGMVHYIGYEPIPMLTSSGVIRLRIQNDWLPSYYLAMVLDSPMIRLQFERECSGSNISHWNLDRVRDCRIPILDQPIMESFDKRLQYVYKEIANARDGIVDAIAMLNQILSVE